MTNKERQRIKTTAMLIVGLFAGLFIGTIITSLRYDSEIRTDQVALKEQVEEIMADRAVIADLISELLLQIEHIKAERKALEELRIRLGEGE